MNTFMSAFRTLGITDALRTDEQLRQISRKHLTHPRVDQATHA